jgi:hypothetical protein
LLYSIKKYIECFSIGFFCLGVPEKIYCNYVDDEVHDVFAIENLLATGLQFSTGQKGRVLADKN